MRRRILTALAPTWALVFAFTGVFPLSAFGQEGEGTPLSELPPPPWASTTDVPAPDFLDTTDERIVDDRPPPTREQVAALLELEAEVERFTQVGNAYRDTINSTLRREYARRRRERQAGYARMIQEEERLQNEARDRAIALFEAFLRRYPNDPTYSPDAMFRLGELYYERSALAFQEAADRGEAPESGHADFRPTIELYRELIRRFPDYRRIDGAYYLIGYCLNEMGRLEEARLAWLTLVCANNFDYRGEELRPQVDPDAEEGEDPADEHPSLSLDPEPPPPGPDDSGPFVDPYADCRPAVETPRFENEVWLRIGEYHFDYDFGRHGLDRAISAYNKVLAHPDDRNYNLALYKVAWSYYRASRYPEAIEHFARLIDWSDEQLAATGRAGTELRAEAMQYIAITLAYDDWNENQIPDEEEGGASIVERIQDPNLVPQDREWTVEAYHELGQILFEEAKYPEAVQVWELALARWPNHRRAPEIVSSIARAHQRNQDMAAALRQQARLANEFLEGSEWWEANRDNPIEQRRAEELAEGALLSEAYRHHQRAQRLRREAVEERNPAKLEEALEAYNLAAQAYRGYISAYPNSPNAYELQYNLADAYYWSEQYEEAARAYASVRDSNLDDRFLSESAHRVVQSLGALAEQAERDGTLQTRDEAPEAEGEPPRVRPIEMPLLVQRLAQAREIYLARVPERQDSERVRAPYDYNNALLLYFYGYWPQARARFLRIYEERCSGPLANETGQIAWEALRNMAIQMNDTAEVERLGQDVTRRGCTFESSEEGEAPRSIDCNDSANRDHPICQAGGDLTNIRYQRALEVYAQAEAASGDEQRQLYERSATMLVEAVNDEPEHPEAPRALIQAAVALEQTQRFDSAGRLYQRVIDEVGPVQADDDERQAQLDNILGTAYFRLAYTANRFFDYDRAVENYRSIADSQRFARSADPEMPARITDSLINAARILEYQQQYQRAAQYYQRAASEVSDPEERRNAYFRVAEMSYKRRDYNGTIREMQSFINRYGNDRAAGELVVLAHWRIAQAREAQRQAAQHRTALQAVVSAFERMQQPAGSMAAEYAANARFQIVDPTLAELESLRINPGTQRTLDAFVSTLNSQIQEGSRRTQTVAQGYEPILAYRRPVWTIAALARQGRAYEILARAVLNANLTMPTELATQIRGAPEHVREEVRLQFEDQVRQTLDTQVRPIECFAVIRYSLAARAAQRGSIDTAQAQEAIDRLQAYGDERIAECITEHRAREPSFEAYRPGEFVRARRGVHLDVDPNLAAPPLAREQR